VHGSRHVCCVHMCVSPASQCGAFTGDIVYTYCAHI
jgi:hypothetical protein